MTNISSKKRRLVSNIAIAILVLSFTLHLEAIQPEPDNAALLYYQALLIKPENTPRLLINKVLCGAEPNETIRKYIQSCDHTIKLIEESVQIPLCNWGAQYSISGYNFIHLLGEMSDLASLLEVNAIILASDGKYKEALEKCITVQRFAKHIANNGTLTQNLFSIQIHAGLFSCINRILGLKPLDKGTLTWLQAQLSMHNHSITISKALENDRDFIIESLRKDPIQIQAWKLRSSILLGLPYEEKQSNNELLVTIKRAREIKEMMIMPDEKLKETMKIGDEEIKEFRDTFSYSDQIKNEFHDLLSHTDEHLVESARQAYDSFLYQFIRIIESNVPYKQKVNEIQRIEKQVNKNIFNPCILLYQGNINFIDAYNEQVFYEASYNIIKVAVEVYLVIAQTGKLPEKLPDYLTKDPYSGEEFIYEVTNDGFILRCRIEDFLHKKVPQYEFKVVK